MSDPPRAEHAVAYLTVDDAPSPDFDEKLDWLVANDVPAVFFCEGAKLDRRPDPVVRAIRAGYPIGNHSYHHPRFSEISLDRAREEIHRTDRRIDALYDEAGVERPARLFRFPFGDKGDGDGDETHPESSAEKRAVLQTFLADAGYETPPFERVTYDWYRETVADDVDWFWTFDAREYDLDETAVFDRLDRDDPERRDGYAYSHDSADIVLVHDHADTTALFAPIVERLQENGVRFVDPPLEM